VGSVLEPVRVIEADPRAAEDNGELQNEAVRSGLLRLRNPLGLELRRFVPVVRWDGRGGVGEMRSDDSDEGQHPSSGSGDSGFDRFSLETSSCGSDKEDATPSQWSDWTLGGFDENGLLASLEAG
jgi:hypothetical protein